jgi:hypothetical protein
MPSVTSVNKIIGRRKPDLAHPLGVPAAGALSTHLRFRPVFLATMSMNHRAGIGLHSFSVMIGRGYIGSCAGHGFR